jgi:hypothetical protein
MNILPPALAFTLELALATGAGPRAGSEAAASPAADLAGGLMLLTVDEQGAIVGMAEVSGIADAIGAIEKSPAAARLLILLVPVAADAASPHPTH